MSYYYFLVPQIENIVKCNGHLPKKEDKIDNTKKYENVTEYEITKMLLLDYEFMK